MNALRIARSLWPAARFFRAEPARPQHGAAGVHLARVCVGDNQTYAFASREGARVRCAAGCVWLTQAGDGRDIILRCGDEFACRGSGKVVVCGLQGSVLWITRRERQ